MPLTCFTDVHAVQSVGSLREDSTAGGANVKQLEAAIELASSRLKEIVTSAAYAEVLSWSEVDMLADASKQAKRAAFENAESLLAIGKLAVVTHNSLVGEGGLQKSVEVGQSKKNFASLEESKGIAAEWEKEALRVLAPFLSAIITDDVTGENVAVRSKRGFYMTIV